MIRSRARSDDETVRRLVDDHADAAVEDLTVPIEFEEVSARRLSHGDRVLLRPGDRIPGNGTVLAVLTADEDGFVETCVVETDDEERTARDPGDDVDEGEYVREVSVLVELTDRAVLPWWLLLGRALSGQRVLVVVVVVIVALIGTGLGQFGAVQDLLNDTGITDEDETAESVAGEDAAAPPPVTATPPESASDDGPPPGTQTSPDESTSQPDDSPDTQVSDTAAPSMDSRGGDGGVGGGGSGPSAPGSTTIDASLSITSADPPLYRSTDGTIGQINGTVGGSLEWRANRVDAVVLVVQVWVPGEGWAETRRVSLVANGAGPLSKPLDLRSTLGDSVEYANASRSGPFENPTADTLRRTDGRVAVTAILYDGTQEVDRVTATDTFTVSVEHVEFDLQLDAGDPNATASLLSAERVTPESEWVNRGNLTNRGSIAGEVSLTNVTYTSYENGQVEPEAAVDPTGGDPGKGAGELQSALDARIVVVPENGTRRYVFGDGDAYRPFSQLRTERVTIAALAPGETVTIEIEYRIDPGAGNEIQSDSLVVDFGFTMVELD